VFVDATTEAARERSIRRHAHGQESWKNGQGFGGRIVPSFVASANNPTPGSGHLSRNSEVFASVRSEFDSTAVFNAVNGIIASATGSRWSA